MLGSPAMVDLITKADPASSFWVTAPPIVWAGEEFSVQITALNALGQTEIGYNGDYHINWSTTAGTSPNGTEPVMPDDDPVSFVKGVATVSGFRLYKAESGVSISVVEKIAEQSIIGTSDPITVKPVADLAIVTPDWMIAGQIYVSGKRRWG